MRKLKHERTWIIMPKMIKLINTNLSEGDVKILGQMLAIVWRDLTPRFEPIEDNLFIKVTMSNYHKGCTK